MLSRRELLKWGLLGGGATMLAPKGLLGRVSADNGDLFHSPATQPFRMALPKPRVAQPVLPFQKVIAPEFDALDPMLPDATFYELVAEERFVQVHPDLPPTAIWGYRDRYDFGPDFVVPGPTFRAYQGKPVVMRMHNNLPVRQTGFGKNEITVHLHGGHTPFRSDGFPTSRITLPAQFQLPQGVPFGSFGTGKSYDYYYPLQDPGFLSGNPDPQERASTLWYHDHRLEFTGPNVYRGLAGFFLVFDEYDTGDETGALYPATNLRLPSGPNGEFDIPLLIQDKSFASNGTLLFSTFEHDGFLGDKFLVNGAIQPYLKVKRRKYRFRILNGSNARFYQLFLSRANRQTFPFDHIATEAGLMARPIRGVESVLVVPAWRVDVVVDFSQFNEGDELFLENRLLQTEGTGPDGLGGRTPLLKFIVEEAVPDPSQVPDVLRPITPVSAGEQRLATRRSFEFDQSNGGWTINERVIGDASRTAFQPRVDGSEVWRLKNGGGGWSHPIHIHQEFMRVLKRNGRTPPLNERDGNARKDTVLLGPDDEVEIFIRFRDFGGPFVFHCHNLEHEDMAMMLRFDIQPKSAGPVQILTAGGRG
jgi:FtsP/CotA-like multicopper oxidase with cupredoxin domain